jgi:hypothetical protein
MSSAYLWGLCLNSTQPRIKGKKRNQPHPLHITVTIKKRLGGIKIALPKYLNYNLSRGLILHNEKTLFLNSRLLKVTSMNGLK